ncbi:hypothetical protein [Nonomuraea sp. SBT364]|uniref:hypothetical protein n=1 Tax=Nonomuraea sp. SBT364 TaxID=1580530 RepID=UPI00066B48C7|nr:hypothetical protein [Nonomuraea sp. SBT364]
MKRIITGLALASAAALVTATPAQAAAPKNPVAAVKKHIAPGKGVKFTERTTIIEDGEGAVFLRRTGSFAFGRSGVVASDITGKLAINADDLDAEEDSLLAALTKSERTIRVGTTSYLSGGIWASVVPEGETWYKVPHGPPAGMLGMFGQPVNIAEPATLKALFKNAKPATGGYKGKITVGELRKASAWFRASRMGAKDSAKTLKAPINWRLTVDAKGLPTRLVTTFAGSALSLDGGNLSIDTRFTGWGGKLTIKAPSADEVTTDLEEGGEKAVEEFGKLNGIARK